MEPAYWHSRWEKGEIGFHLLTPNPRLLTWWPQLQMPTEAMVFVPLCGKSLDMVWLRQQGHTVVGVEISPLAVQQFFAENGMTPQVEQQGDFTCYTTDGFRLLCGDYFDLTPAVVWGETASCAVAIYDRAALVALPPARRRAYAAQMRALAPSGSRMLLLTFAYPQTDFPGPPFSVSPAEVHQLYGAAADIEHWCDEEALSLHPGLQARGVRELREHVFALRFR
ncbi:MAG: thiopurine S-methyltransferase [Gloeomargarita sp. SKYBB_i_bin120]|nr:thiopurine S-methyltransferase [Gloeomargarita sp. SKYB120]MDW8178034.1 thiopurine S-methyltransferase [Gloeomargarita sp. SKYBB_i_bin120]